MKLQIRTKNKNTLQVEMKEEQTVYELKKELALYADIGIEPEFQQLNAEGKILRNNRTLKECEIDIKRPITVTIFKKAIVESPSPEPIDIKETNEEEAKQITNETPTINNSSNFRIDETTIPKENSEEDESKLKEKVEQIVNMGYAEADVLAALKASYNNVQRAIEYLVEGLPTAEPPAINYAELFGYDSGSDGEVSITDVLRCDPVVRSLRTSIHQNPEIINATVKRLCEVNPSALRLINENQDVFLKMLIEENAETDSEDEVMVSTK